MTEAETYEALIDLTVHESWPVLIAWLDEARDQRIRDFPYSAAELGEKEIAFLRGWLELADTLIGFRDEMQAQLEALEYSDNGPQRG